MEKTMREITMDDVFVMMFLDLYQAEYSAWLSVVLPNKLPLSQNKSNRLSPATQRSYQAKTCEIFKRSFSVVSNDSHQNENECSQAFEERNRCLCELSAAGQKENVGGLSKRAYSA